MSRSQRNKGKRGEREAAKAVSVAFGVRSRRGVQYQGGPSSADIQVDIPGIHWEVKFVEKEAVRAWVKQAIEDASGKVPVVLHRKSRAPWLVTLPLERVYEFALRLAEAASQAFPEVGPGQVPGAVPAEVLPETPGEDAGHAGVL
jgi:hypothetical protein